jgi:hypothetical protein
MNQFKNIIFIPLLTLITSCGTSHNVDVTEKMEARNTLFISPTKMIELPTGKSFKLSHQVCGLYSPGLTLHKYYDTNNPIEKMKHFYLPKTDLTTTNLSNAHMIMLKNIVGTSNIVASEKNGLVKIPQQVDKKQIGPNFNSEVIYYEIYDLNNSDSGFYHTQKYNGLKYINIPSQFIHANSNFVVKYSLETKSDLNNKRYKNGSNNRNTFKEKKGSYNCSGFEKMTINMPFSIDSLTSAKALYVINAMIISDDK